jgi:hypothetical protein
MSGKHPRTRKNRCYNKIMNPDEPQPNYDQPVAYDAQGRPLYAHPPKPEQAPPASVPVPAPTPPPAPQVVHLSRPAEPMRTEVSEEVRQKHEQARRAYPFLNLSESEYVIRAVRRHPIGLILPMAMGVLLIAIAMTVLFNYASIAELLSLRGAAASIDAIIVPVLLFTILVGLGMFIIYYIYVNNKFFLTNESVIQEIQHSLFSRLEQTVSLANIEDASFTQQGIIQHIFNYGAIRLSTEGDETTYRFTYVANPKDHVAVLNNAVEAFKNGRPVSDPDQN